MEWLVWSGWRAGVGEEQLACSGWCGAVGVE